MDDKSYGENRIMEKQVWLDLEEIGEWDKEDIIDQAGDEDYVAFFKKLLDPEMLGRIDNIDFLIEDLGYDSVAYAFSCTCCNKITIVCQDY